MITEGYLARHYQGRADGRSPALIDIAQDHVLHLLHEAGVFELGAVLKGGTAIRKFRAGNAGRFSTDLDFAGVDETTAELILDALDNAELDEFRFYVERLHTHRRARLNIDTPFGSPVIPARIDLSPKAAWLGAEKPKPGGRHCSVESRPRTSGRAFWRPPTGPRDATERPAAPASHPHSGHYVRGGGSDVGRARCH